MYIDTSSNLIVYGNHIQNSKLFGELEKYKNRVFLESHKIIELITLDKTIYYETLILSTCEYSTPDGRLLVIAKKII